MKAPTRTEQCSLVEDNKEHPSNRLQRGQKMGKKAQKNAKAALGDITMIGDVMIVEKEL